MKEQNNSVVGDKKEEGGGKVGQAIKDLCLGPITKVARLKKKGLTRLTQQASFIIVLP